MRDYDRLPDKLRLPKLLQRGKERIEPEMDNGTHVRSSSELFAAVVMPALNLIQGRHDVAKGWHELPSAQSRL